MTDNAARAYAESLQSEDGWEKFLKPWIEKEIKTLETQILEPGVTTNVDDCRSRRLALMGTLAHVERCAKLPETDAV